MVPIIGTCTAGISTVTAAVTVQPRHHDPDSSSASLAARSSGRPGRQLLGRLRRFFIGRAGGVGVAASLAAWRRRSRPGHCGLTITADGDRQDQEEAERSIAWKPRSSARRGRSPVLLGRRRGEAAVVVAERGPASPRSGGGGDDATAASLQVMLTSAPRAPPSGRPSPDRRWPDTSRRIAAGRRRVRLRRGRCARCLSRS